MGEVTVEVNEEVTAHSFESLPEPLLLILSPPPPFLPAPGEPTAFWHKWLKAFEHYVDGLGENTLADSSKCSLLKSCLGQEGQRVFAALLRDESTYAAAVSVLTVYFGSDRRSRARLLEFRQRAQVAGESAEQFVAALEALLRPCGCGDSHDKLLLSQLMEKTNCPRLRARLLPEKDSLTLAAALAAAKEVDSAAERPEALGVPEVGSDAGDDGDVPKVAKRGRPRRRVRRAGAHPSLTETPGRPSRYKNRYYYSKDAEYYDDDEQGSKGVDGGKASNKGPGGTCSSLSSHTTEEEGLEKAGGEDEDDDYDVSSLSLKGPLCHVCDNRRFRDAHKLARHMRTHTKEKPFACPTCSVTFSQSYHMTRHMRNQHGAGQHVCSTCGKSLGSPAELQSHKKTHGPRAPSCPESPEKFQGGAELSLPPQTEGHDSQQRVEAKAQDAIEPGGEDNHESDDVAEVEPDDARSAPDGARDDGPQVSVKMEDKDSGGKSQDGGVKTEHVAPGKKTKGHFCPICDNRRFRGPNKLARHMRTHTKEKPFSCTVCAMTFSQSYHMTRHQRNKHGLGQYICPKCGKTFGNWLELKDHKKIHGAEGLACPACDKRFKGKAAFISHLRSHKKVQAGPRRLVCSDCGKVFGRLYHLKRHIMTHRKAANSECYSCPECQKSYAFQDDLKKHLEIHAKQNSGTCPKCNEAFSRPEELEAHMGVHEKSYMCNTCGKKFKVEYALKKHEQGHEDEQYYCSLCRKRFIKLSHYKRHVLVHDRRESKCPHCDSVFLQLTALKYHLRTHTAERPHQCSCCIETFEEKKDLDQHCLKHRKLKRERPYSCTRCDDAFPTLTGLTEHMAAHEGEEPMSCPICGKTFLNKNKLEKHLSIHTGERPHLCPTCGNGFPSAASLKLHTHIHTGEKPFKCSQCSKSFRSSSGLRLHGRQHMEVRPSYECPECGRTYGRMTELKMHQRYHTGDKPYSCTCCNKRFISKDKLNVHMRIHTGERPYSCQHCGQTFTQTGDRNRHINKFHK